MGKNLLYAPPIPVIRCCVCGSVLDYHVYGFHGAFIYCVPCAPVGTIFFGSPTLEVKIDFTGTAYRLSTSTAGGAS